MRLTIELTEDEANQLDYAVWGWCTDRQQVVDRRAYLPVAQRITEAIHIARAEEREARRNVPLPAAGPDDTFTRVAALADVTRRLNHQTNQWEYSDGREPTDAAL